MCLGGSSVMFSRAAFSVAPRKAFLPLSNPPIDLDLAGPSRPFPVVADEEVEGKSRPLPDLTASPSPVARGELPPASVVSPAQEAFRRELFDAPQSAFEVSAAAGAVRMYEATLRAIVPEVALKLGSQVLPMCTEVQFFAFFGAVLLLCPKSSSPAPSQLVVLRNYVKLAKAAAAYWHVVRGTRAVFGGAWSPRLGFFLVGSQEEKRQLDSRAHLDVLRCA